MRVCRCGIYNEVKFHYSNKVFMSFEKCDFLRECVRSDLAYFWRDAAPHRRGSWVRFCYQLIILCKLLFSGDWMTTLASSTELQGFKDCLRFLYVKMSVRYILVSRQSNPSIWDPRAISVHAGICAKKIMINLRTYLLLQWQWNFIKLQSCA